MSSPDSLDELLDRWHPAEAARPDLRARVRAELTRARQVERPSWLRRLDLAFARPSFAITFIAACVLLGLFLAEARVSRLHEQYGAEVARSYVQLIDPLLNAETSTPPAP